MRSGVCQRRRRSIRKVMKKLAAGGSGTRYTDPRFRLITKSHYVLCHIQTQSHPDRHNPSGDVRAVRLGDGHSANVIEW